MPSVNLVGYVEHPVLGESPYRVGRDGVSYVPVGDGGIVLGLELGDSVFKLAADHAAPGACLLHPDAAARHALAAFACIGNRALVRTGAAAGATGGVIGKRGEGGRVIVGFRPADLALMRPSDEVLVRASGQGWRPAGMPPGVAVMNVDPATFAALPVHVSADGSTVTAAVRCTLPSKLAGKWDWPPRGELGSGSAADVRRPRHAAGRSRRGDRYRCAVQHGIPPRLADGRRRSPRREPATRSRARHHADPDRAGCRAAGDAGCGWPRWFDCSAVEATVTDDSRSEAQRGARAHA